MTTFKCSNPECTFSLELQDGKKGVIKELCPCCINDDIEQQSLAAAKHQEMIYT